MNIPDDPFFTFLQRALAMRGPQNATARPLQRAERRHFAGATTGKLPSSRFAHHGAAAGDFPQYGQQRAGATGAGRLFAARQAGHARGVTPQSAGSSFIAGVTRLRGRAVSPAPARDAA